MGVFLRHSARFFVQSIRALSFSGNVDIRVNIKRSVTNCYLENCFISYCVAGKIMWKKFLDKKVLVVWDEFKGAIAETDCWSLHGCTVLQRYGDLKNRRKRCPILSVKTFAYYSNCELFYGAVLWLTFMFSFSF